MSVGRWVETITLSEPCLGNNTADAERLAAELRLRLAVEAVEIDPELLRLLPGLLRRHAWSLRVVFLRDGQRLRLCGLLPPGSSTVAAGLAVDLGTTHIVLRLLDLENGQNLGEISLDNPQRAVGSDILTRLHHAQDAVGSRELRDLAAGAIAEGASRLCRSAGLAEGAICAAAVAGNTAMTHLLLGLDPRWMIREPYIPVVNRPGILAASALGFPFHPGAQVYFFPNVGSYFGGDLVAGILYSGIDRQEGTALLVDVGTNAEAVIGNRHWLMACAGAAGPALEGGAARIGMAAEAGVIDRVRLGPGGRTLTCSTIGGLPPKGICGSGLIDLAAALFRSGRIDLRGKLVPTACGERYETVDGQPHFLLIPGSQSASGAPLRIGQADLDSLVRAKAAMYAVLETLLATVGTAFSDLEAFFVAGTFGAFIDPAAAIAIGMLPDLPLTRFRVIGNSSLEGAARLLGGAIAPAAIDALRERITYLELNVNQEFMNRFSAARFIPHTDRARFPSAGVAR